MCFQTPPNPLLFEILNLQFSHSQILLEESLGGGEGQRVMQAQVHSTAPDLLTFITVDSVLSLTLLRVEDETSARDETSDPSPCMCSISWRVLWLSSLPSVSLRFFLLPPLLRLYMAL